MSELDEELLRFEERDLLLARLLECKTFKDAAAVLEGHLRVGSRSVPRTAARRAVPVDGPGPARAGHAQGAARGGPTGLAPKVEPVVDTFHLAPIRASVRDAAEALLLSLPYDRPMSFRALVAGIEDRIELIVRFLAVLELFKQGVVDLTQIETFGDLVVRRLTDGERVLDDESLDDWDDVPAPVG